MHMQRTKDDADHAELDGGDPLTRPSTLPAASQTVSEMASAMLVTPEDVGAKPACRAGSRRTVTLAKKRLQHCRLGHRNNADVAKMRTRNMVDNMNLDGDFPSGALADIADDHPDCGDLSCEACAKAKARRQPFPEEAKPHEYDVLDRITVDTCGPLPV